MAQQGRGLAIERQIQIRVVVGKHDVVVDSAGHGGIEPGLLTRGGGGVMREAENHQPQGIPLGVAQVVVIGPPAPLRIQGEQHRFGGGQLQAAPVGWIARIQQQGGVPGVQHRQGQMGCALLGAHQQQHLPLRIHRHREASEGPSRNRLAKGQGGAVQAIGGAGRFVQGDPDRLKRYRRWLEIGGAERQIEKRREVRAGVQPPAVNLLALVIAGEDAATQLGDPGRDLLRDGHPGRR